MRVAVVGAGIVGVTAAFELARDGHAVTVYERRASVAEETSFANAGVVAPGYVTPWAAPGMPGKVLKQIPNQQFNHAIVYVPKQEGVAEGFFIDTRRSRFCVEAGAGLERTLGPGSIRPYEVATRARAARSRDSSSPSSSQGQRRVLARCV